MSHQIFYGLKARVTTPVLYPAAAALLGLGQGAKLLCSLQMASDFGEESGFTPVELQRWEWG